MDVLDKLRSEVRKFDWCARRSLHPTVGWRAAPAAYDFEAADMRELLEQAIREIEQQRLRNDLCRSVIADYSEQLTV